MTPYTYTANTPPLPSHTVNYPSRNIINASMASQKRTSFERGKRVMRLRKRKRRKTDKERGGRRKREGRRKKKEMRRRKNRRKTRRRVAT